MDQKAHLSPQAHDEQCHHHEGTVLNMRQRLNYRRW
jgi:hypothetical protein